MNDEGAADPGGGSCCTMSTERFREEFEERIVALEARAVRRELKHSRVNGDAEGDHCAQTGAASGGE